MPAQKKASRKKKTSGGMKQPARRWSHKVTSDSTHPPPGLFTKDAATIARTMADTRVSPKGIGSGIRMIQFFINRAGKGLSKTRRRELERAKKILQEKQKEGG